jgi:outer membrane protein insertion porin family
MDRTASPRRWAWLVAVCAALSLSAHCLAAQPSADDQREAPEVKKLTWRGVKHVPQYELDRSIQTTSSQCRSLLLIPFCLVSHSPLFYERHYLDRDELKKDVLRIRVLYYKHGYRDATVDTTVAKSGNRQVVVTLEVHEGEPTRIASIRVEYDSTILTEKRVKRLAMLKAGMPLDLITLDSARLLFLGELWDKGYGDAVVDTGTTAEPDQRTGTVLFRLTPNPRTTVASVNIRGNERITESTIRNSIMLRPGGLFRRNDVLESQRTLYESNLFRQARISVPATRDSAKHVNVEVIEGKLHGARVGGGFNNVDFFQLEARYTNFNVFGGARRLDVTASAGNLGARQLNGKGIFRDVLSITGTNSPDFLQPTWDASVDFRQPAFMRKPENALGLGVFGHRRSVPGIYIDRGYGASAVFTRTLQERMPLSATYRYEITRVEASDVYFCIAYGVCDAPTLSALRSHQSLSPILVTFLANRSDQPFSPTKGYMAEVDLEHASAFTASDYRYNRAFVDFAAYTHRSGVPRNVLAGHLRLGFVRALSGSNTEFGISVLHPRKRFYAGGANSVRGYAEAQLGPRILTIAPGDLKNATDVNGAPCDTATINIRLCNPNSGSIADSRFHPQPLGGTSLIEGSVEYRFGTPIHRHLDAAVFLDGAMVGGSSLRDLGDFSGLVRGTGAITPGFGIRYISPVGPIRVDLGINPKVAEDLSVISEIHDASGKQVLVPLTTKRTFSPSSGAVLNRLVLHFSIGQAY